MGMSTHVMGFRAPDEEFKKMRAAWDACEAAGVSIPDEVEDYFGGTSPDPSGVEVDIEAHEWSNEYAQGYEINVADIPKGLTSIRFYYSW